MTLQARFVRAAAALVLFAGMAFSAIGAVAVLGSGFLGQTVGGSVCLAQLLIYLAYERASRTSGGSSARTLVAAGRALNATDEASHRAGGAPNEPI